MVVGIDTVSDCVRQVAELFRIEILITLFIREQKHHATAPFFQVLLHGSDVAHSVVSRFLARTQDSYHIITAARCCQYAGFFAVVGTFELVFRVEVTNHLNFVRVFTHFQFCRGCLARLYIEERNFCQYTAVSHTGSGYHHIVTFVHAQRSLQHTAPGIAYTHIHITGTFKVQCLQLSTRQYLGDREMTVIFRVLQSLDRSIGSNDLTLFSGCLNSSFKVHVHPVAVFHILYLAGYRLDTCRDTQATAGSHKENIT